jgi:hypothetical protein
VGKTVNVPFQSIVNFFGLICMLDSGIVIGTDSAAWTKVPGDLSDMIMTGSVVFLLGIWGDVS